MATGSRLASNGQDPLFFDYADSVNVGLEEADRSIAEELKISTAGREHPFTWESAAIRNRSHERYLRRYVKPSANSADRAVELHEQTESIKSWKSVVLALLVIACICGIIALTIVLVTPVPQEDCGRPPFPFENLFNESFAQKRLKYTWQNDVLYFVQGAKIVRLDPDNHRFVNDSVTILAAEEINQREIAKFYVSGDERYVAIEISKRASPELKYILFDKTRKTTRWVAVNYERTDSDVYDVQSFDWCPTRSSCFLFVHNNNVFYSANSSATPIQLTTSGEVGLVYNLVTDWMYEQEVLHAPKTLRWSPSGAKLAFAEINVTRVPIYTYSTYDGLYPRSTHARYPRAGDNRSGILPEVKLVIFSIHDVCRVGEIETPKVFPQGDGYLIGLDWLSETVLIAEWANRLQDKSYTFTCTLPDSCNATIKCSEIQLDVNHHAEISQSGWIDTKQRKFFGLHSEDSANINYVTTALRNTHGDLVRSLAVVSGGEQLAATRYLHNAPGTETHEVAQLVKVDPESAFAYFTAPKFSDAKSMHLYRVQVNPDSQRGPDCLSCDVPACNYVTDVSFSSTARFYVLTCLTDGVLKYTLRHTDNMEQSLILEDNDALERELLKFSLPKKEYHILRRTSPSGFSYELEIEVQLPENVNHVNNPTYPLLLYINNQPDTMTVTNDSTLDWLTHICSVHNVIVAKVDGRGSSGRGRRFAFAVHKNLGAIDAEDQTAALSYLTGLKFIDKARVAMAGFSYGGFLVLRILTTASFSTPIACAVSISPITDWQLFATPFTERYLGSYTDSLVYEKSTLLSNNVWHSLNQSKLLLVHGTADEKVHFEHSLRLMKLLNDLHVQYSAQIYPDSNHQLATSPVRRHFFRRIIEFIHSCLENRTTTHHQHVPGQEKKRR